jgi:hypothetical protein
MGIAHRARFNAKFNIKPNAKQSTHGYTKEFLQVGCTG